MQRGAAPFTSEGGDHLPANHLIGQIVRVQVRCREVNGNAVSRPFRVHRFGALDFLMELLTPGFNGHPSHGR